MAQSQSKSYENKADARSVPDIMKGQSIIRLMLVLLLAAYASYLFHEFGHWLVGTLLGNEMSMSLNGAWPTSGVYLKESHSLPVGIGGPAFTILQALIALVIIEKYRTLLAYPFLVFPLVFRVFSLTLGEFRAQDEAGISATLGLGKYTVVIVVCSILLGLVWRGSRTLKLNGSVITRFIGACLVSMLMVIATHKLFLS
jgi:hypothetical protein